ncbi:MAG: PIN domain-containing protein [Chloroflexota bacterium]|nr:PIN domain-containing protein [Chloroflexota bacterium]
MLVLDSSGIIALLDSLAPSHARVAELLLAERGPRYLSPFVMHEIDHLVASRVGSAAALRFHDDVARGAYELAPLDRSDVGTAVGVMRRYADMRLGLADASIVVLAARYRTSRILTLDERHFRAVLPLQGGAFTILPADA